MNWLKQNWFKLFLIAILFVIAVELFFALYPRAYEGFQVYRALPPHKIISEWLFPRPASEQLKLINRFEKQP